MKAPHCCYLHCGKPAEFGIYGSSGHFEDVTEACADHVGFLLGTPTWLTRENTHWAVYPMPVVEVVPRERSSKARALNPLPTEGQELREAAQAVADSAREGSLTPDCVVVNRHLLEALRLAARRLVDAAPVKPYHREKPPTEQFWALLEALRLALATPAGEQEPTDAQVEIVCREWASHGDQSFDWDDPTDSTAVEREGMREDARRHLRKIFAAAPAPPEGTDVLDIEDQDFPPATEPAAARAPGPSAVIEVVDMGTKWGEWEVLVNGVSMYCAASQRVCESFADRLRTALNESAAGLASPPQTREKT